MKAGAESVTIQDLYLEEEIGIRYITGFWMQVQPGIHARAEITAVADLSSVKKWVYGQVNRMTLTVKGKGEEILFAGIIDAAEMKVNGGVCELTVNLISGTSLFDITEESRSWQNPELTWRQVMKDVVSETEGAGMISSEIMNTSIGQPVIRYRETAWDFLGRMASHKNQPLIPDIHTNGAPKVYIGLPEAVEKRVEWADDEIASCGTDSRFLDLGGYEAGLVPSDYMTYTIEGYQNYRIGQRGRIKGREVRIQTVSARIEEGELKYLYLAAPEGFSFVPKRYNLKLSGMSLLGTVTRREGENLWLHLDIDEGRSSVEKTPWPWRPPTGNSMYLMPSIGTRVSLYFSNADESSGRGTNCIRQNGSSMGNPADRRLRTEHRKLLNMTSKELSLTSEYDGGLSMRMSSHSTVLTGKNIYISGTSIRLQGKRISFMADEKDSAMELATGSYELKEYGVTFKETAQITLGAEREGDVFVLGENKMNIWAEPSDKVYEQIRDGQEYGSFNWGASIENAAVSVVVVGGAVMLVVATYGSAAGVAIPVMTYVQIGSVAATAGAFKVASDYAEGSVSSLNDYMLSVLYAEFIYLTNTAAGILTKPFGYGTSLIARTMASAGVDVGFQQMLNGEVDWGKVGQNMLIDFFVNVGGDMFSEALSKKMAKGKISEGTESAGTSTSKRTGTDRAAEYSSSWGNESVEDAINRFAPDATPIYTDKGKIIYRNDTTGIEVVYDKNGNYFRIVDTNLSGKRTALDINGNIIPNNVLTDRGTQRGLTQGEYNAASHFNNTDSDFNP